MRYNTAHSWLPTTSLCTIRLDTAEQRGGVHRVHCSKGAIRARPYGDDARSGCQGLSRLGGERSLVRGTTQQGLQHKQRRTPSTVQMLLAGHGVRVCLYIGSPHNIFCFITDRLQPAVSTMLCFSFQSMTPELTLLGSQVR